MLSSLASFYYPVLMAFPLFPDFGARQMDFCLFFDGVEESFPVRNGWAKERFVPHRVLDRGDFGAPRL